MKVLGSYGCASRPEMIGMKMNTSSQSPSEDIARLAGVRFTNISEPSKGLILNSALVKSMTGNDTLNARFLHENSFDFRPQFKIYINTNYRPSINDMTLFTSNRVIVIPFERQFDESEQDKDLKTLFAGENHKSAILNWLIEGYMHLRREGLDPPESVKEAIRDYQQDSDKITQFVDDVLVEAPAQETKTALLYDRYRQWCQENGCFAENSRNFNQALRTIAEVVRKRPRTGGNPTTLLIGYRIRDGTCPL